MEHLKGAVAANAQTRRPSRARVLAWAGLGALFAFRLALAELVAAGSWPALAWAQVAYLLPLTLGFVGAVVCAIRTEGIERRFWSLLTVALALFFASEIYVSAYILWVDPAGPLPPASFQILHAAAVLVFFLCVVTMTPIGSAPIWTRIRFYLYVLAGTIVATAAAYLTAVLPVFRGLTGVSEGAFPFAALYVVFAVIMVASTVSVFLTGAPLSWRPWEWFVAASFVLFALGLLSWPLWLFSRASGAASETSMSLVELGLSTGTYLFFMASVYRTTAPDAAWRHGTPRLGAFAHPWFSIVYQGALVVCVPVIGAIGFSLGDTTEGLFVLSCALVLAATLALLNWSMSLESASLERRALSDSLTGLPNERAFAQRVTDGMLSAARLGERINVAVVDIDDFSRVNDVAGHVAGDELLVNVANRLCEDSRGVCDVYRVGGDEFGLVLPGVSAEDAAELVRRLLSAVTSQTGGPSASVTISGGIASSADGETDAGALLQRAFAALQVAKLRQRGSVEIYDLHAEEPLAPEERLERARKQWHLSTVRALAAAVDARDPASRDHSREVARLSRKLAERLGLPAERVSAIELAATVHDIGKLALADDLLVPRPIESEDERALFREHVELGERILRSTDLAYVLPWVRAHHERWDGFGYPDGLSGTAIPLEARVLAVCDSYHAMTSGLFTGTATSVSDALREIDLGLGRQFDPEIGATFITMISDELSRSTA